MYKTIKLSCCLIAFCFCKAHAQQDTIRIAVRANATENGIIQLRWVSNSPAAWRFTNTNGIIIERYTLMRGEGILDTPEKVVLTLTPLKPPVLDEWKDIATQNPKAAIIAQALYGKDFEMSGGRSGVSEMIALSQEQEQRFAMSMFAADQSYSAALFARWGFEDKTAVKGERYLYRVIPAGKDTKKVLEEGPAYIGTDDYEMLPKPLDLNGIFGNNSVLITWNYTLLQATYNAYNIERSTDGKTFQRLNKNPLLNFTGGDRIFYTDSIENGKTYYYRVKGLTLFGEEGIVSDTVEGKGIDKLDYTPHIVRIVPDGETVNVLWEFEEAGNKDIAKFELQQSVTESGMFETVTTDISPDKRSVPYSPTSLQNYLRIAAIPKEGNATYSYPFLFQQSDSIPPATPEGLDGLIDSVGVVRLTWRANTESDMLGYRVLRGQTQNDDLIPLNDIAIQDNFFTDTVSLKTLNAKVFYAVAAIDKRYNQSPESPSIALQRPLQVKPAPPYITLCESSEEGIKLEWTAGNDETITGYAVWRNEGKEMKLLKSILSPEEKSFVDKTASDDVSYSYQVVSSNEYKNSDPSPAASARKSGKVPADAIRKFKGKRTDGGILLKWEIATKDCKSVAIYRKDGNAAFVLWNTPELYTNELLDNTAKRNFTYEYLIAIKDLNGKITQTQTKVD